MDHDEAIPRSDVPPVDVVARARQVNSGYLFAIDTDTSGGSSETEVKELAARPASRSPTRAATATTPVGRSRMPFAAWQDPGPDWSGSWSPCSPCARFDGDRGTQAVTHRLKEGDDFRGHRPVLQIVQHVVVGTVHDREPRGRLGLGGVRDRTPVGQRVASPISSSCGTSAGLASRAPRPAPDTRRKPVALRSVRTPREPRRGQVRRSQCRG